MTPKRVVVDIDDDRHLRLKTKVSSEGLTISEVILDMIDKYLNGTK